MKRGLTIGVIVLLLLLTGFFAYRGWEANQAREREALERNRAAQQAQLDKAEAERKLSAEAEARRLAEAKAKKDAEDAERRLAAAKKEREDAEAAARESEARNKRLTDEQERLRLARLQAEEETKRLAALREKDARDAEEKRLAALRALEDAERARRDLEAREQERLAALRKQEELAKYVPASARDFLGRMIYSEGYKRRQHYYMNVELINEGFVAYPVKPFAPQPAPKPAEGTDTAKPVEAEPAK